jgi:hypothetical protein
MQSPKTSLPPPPPQVTSSSSSPSFSSRPGRLPRRNAAASPVLLVVEKRRSRVTAGPTTAEVVEGAEEEAAAPTASPCLARFRARISRPAAAAAAPFPPFPPRPPALEVICLSRNSSPRSDSINSFFAAAPTRCCCCCCFFLTLLRAGGISIEEPLGMGGTTALRGCARRTPGRAICCSTERDPAVRAAAVKLHCICDPTKIHIRIGKLVRHSKFHSLSFGKTEPAVWLISDCFTSE